MRTEPAERIVERVLPSRHPRTVAGWEQALTELAAQCGDGRLAPWHAARVERALAVAMDAAHVLSATMPAGSSAGVTSQPGTLLERRVSPLSIVLWETILRRIQAAGGTLSVTMEGLAASLGTPVGEVSAVLSEGERMGFVAARRYGQDVDIGHLAVHARVELSIR
ncbi:hypothetical protein Ahu01nite_099670 [Winogradskya humida]|uniref:Uncharacterized protein n=1 Tax=Winogradskya humida TaxID=113566 RepID=A0ABQ4A7M3_9ACTN|nr:hypothetical protein Ahu01nite_099670 [Actinoplanes humidus]